MKKTIKTGGVVPVSAQYGIKGTKLEVTFIKGKRVPPYGSKACVYFLKDKTVHKKK